MAEKGVDDDLFEVSEEALLSTDYDEDADFEAGEDEPDPDELDELAEDADIPIELLLARYGYGAAAAEDKRTADSDDIAATVATNAATANCGDDASPIVPTDIAASATIESEGTSDPLWSAPEESTKPSTLMQLVNAAPDMSEDGEESDEEDEDEDYMPQPPSPTLDWRKEIRQGDDYQASIPNLEIDMEQMSVDSASAEPPLWKPDELSESEVQKYLRSALSRDMQEVAGSRSQAYYAYAPDNETALEHLVSCGFNTKLALSSLPNQEGVVTWSEEECSNFEQGLSQYGKNFFLIQREKVPHRSVSELIQFFYIWKKTERYIYFRRTNPARVFSGRRDVYPLPTEQSSSSSLTDPMPSTKSSSASLASSTSSEEQTGTAVKTKKVYSASRSPVATNPTCGVLVSASTASSDASSASRSVSAASLSSSASANIPVEPAAKRPYIPS
ncbi:mesoderm induction early response protein 1-like [Sycon ciliatum]|uniref:mesoderm induction early response protein 1-like n=1 Tax=Sycon ciliatum TaxID=27933 RepID=UPI0031F70047